MEGNMGITGPTKSKELYVAFYSKCHSCQLHPAEKRDERRSWLPSMWETGDNGTYGLRMQMDRTSLVWYTMREA